VRAPGLQRVTISAIPCRPRALTRHAAGALKQLFKPLQDPLCPTAPRPGKTAAADRPCRSQSQPPSHRLAPWDKTSSIRLGSGGAYPTGRDTPAAQRQKQSTIPLTRSRSCASSEQETPRRRGQACVVAADTRGRVCLSHYPSRSCSRPSSFILNRATVVLPTGDEPMISPPRRVKCSFQSLSRG